MAIVLIMYGPELGSSVLPSGVSLDDGAVYIKYIQIITSHSHEDGTGQTRSSPYVISTVSNQQYLSYGPGK